MDSTTVVIGGVEVVVWTCNTVVVGTGVAGWNAADCLVNLGQTDVLVVTEGIKMGTSRNTGSDKQTYYTLAAADGDSVREMAKNLFAGGGKHGDLALVEAALSSRCFYKLVEIGVDFPHSRYGQYIGYKTDHDPKQRGISVGPLTSRIMTEKLEQQVRAKQVPVFDQHLVIGLLTDGLNAIGLITLDCTKLNHPGNGLTLFNCTNIIYATGGPAGMYEASVYPASQTGALGIAFEAGASGVNLTESQYGLASIKFRWNLSGSFQQVIPRYISTAQDGSDQREFLTAYFPDIQTLLTAIFLKGYQWPFDPRKIADYGSSMIDLLVYNEVNNKGRRVFIDYRHNPSAAVVNGNFDFRLLSAEAYSYLEQSELLFGTPVERLQKLNQPAFDLYFDNGIDLTTEPLEIAVCAQHSNGGLQGDLWWESNLKHFFPVGEANGSFGVYRPGGSALNAAQVGSLRAAQCIVQRYNQAPLTIARFLSAIQSQVSQRLSVIRQMTVNRAPTSNLPLLLKTLRQRMSKVGAHVRQSALISQAIRQCRRELTEFPAQVTLSMNDELPDALRYYDLLISQYLYLSAIQAYIDSGGQSRGSYIIASRDGSLPAVGLPEEFRYCLDAGELMHYVGEIKLTSTTDWACSAAWTPVRPLPQEQYWFETLWEHYRTGSIWQPE